MSQSTPVDGSFLLHPHISVIPEFRSSNEGFSQTTCINYDAGTAIELVHDLINRRPPYKCQDWSFYPPDWQIEISRFCIALDAYFDCNFEHAMSLENILGFVARGPEGTAELKRLRQTSFVFTIGASFYESKPEDKKARRIYSDISEIFNYMYLPFWAEETDDYLWGDVDLVEPSPTLLKLYRRSFFRVISQCSRAEIVDPNEILLELRGTSSMTDCQESIPFYKRKLDPEVKLGFASNLGKAKRVVVPLGPANVRDTLVLPMDSFHTVSLIERQTMNIIKSHPWCLQIRDPDLFDQRFESFCKHPFFLSRDFKKDGITKPRWMMNLLIELLHEWGPEYPAYNFLNFFSNFSITLEDGTEFFPKRGHGLGMASALTTLNQIVLVDLLVLKDFEDDDLELFHGVECLVLNDDFSIAFKDESDSEA